MNQKYIVRPW